MHFLCGRFATEGASRLGGGGCLFGEVEESFAQFAKEGRDFTAFGDPMVEPGEQAEAFRTAARHPDDDALLYGQQWQDEIELIGREIRDREGRARQFGSGQAIINITADRVADYAPQT